MPLAPWVPIWRTCPKGFKAPIIITTNMEKFRLIFTGQRCGDYAKLPLTQHLRLLKLSDSATQKILSGSKVALASGLTSNQLQRQKRKLESMGFVTQTQLQLNAQILEAGLKKVEPAPDSLNLTLPVFSPEDTSLPPTFFNRPNVAEIEMEGDTDQPSVEVENYNYQFGSLLLIAVASYAALTMQNYILVVVKGLTQHSALATVCGVVFLLACVLVLPRLFQPLMRSEIRRAGKRIQLFEQAVLVLGKKRISWQMSGSRGEFLVRPESAVASSFKNKAHSPEVLYQWSAQLHLDETSSEAIQEIQSSITEGTVIETAQTLYENVLALVERFRPGREQAKTDWLLAPASAVYQPDGLVVAMIYQGNHSAYRIVRPALQDDLSLHAFCVSILRAGWV